MSVVQAVSACAGCGQLFPYNPIKVPSITVRGTREPICLDCVERANPLRVENGLDPIVPLEGAYGACDESEL
jgi:hypothetical protein